MSAQLEAPWVTHYVRCPKCGGWRVDSQHPHAPRNTATGRVDCVGDAVETPKPKDQP
jgi:hypothetical protein